MPHGVDATERSEAKTPFESSKRARKLDSTTTATLHMEPRKLFIPPVCYLIVSAVAAVLAVVVFSVAEKNTALGIGVGVGAIALASIVGLTGFVMLIRNFLLHVTNVYAVEAVSLSRTFRLFVSHHVEFQCDTITGMIVNRSVFDRLLGTCSVKFWSIGASSALHFNDIDYSVERIEMLKAKVGLAVEPEQSDRFVQPHASLIDVLLRNCFVLLQPVLRRQSVT